MSSVKKLNGGKVESLKRRRELRRILKRVGYKPYKPEAAGAIRRFQKYLRRRHLQGLAAAFGSLLALRPSTVRRGSHPAKAALARERQLLRRVCLHISGSNPRRAALLAWVARYSAGRSRPFSTVPAGKKNSSKIPHQGFSSAEATKPQTKGNAQ